MALRPGPNQRTATQETIVSKTIDGKTHNVPQRRTVIVPATPRDWDQLILSGVIGVAVFGLAGCITWSTYSIGHLLGASAPDAIAYVAAGTFDTLWISGYALQWLSRFEPDKARAAKNSGNLSLTIAMAALVIEGYVFGHVAAGIVGAFISLGVKRLWQQVLGYHAYPLDELTQGWVTAERSDIGARLAMAGAQRLIRRQEKLLAAYQHAADTPDGPRPGPRGLSTDMDNGLPPKTVEVLRYAILEMPDAESEQIVQQLATMGHQVSTDDVDNMSAAMDNAGDRHGQDVDNVIVLPSGQRVSIADIVRKFIKDTGQTDTDVVWAAVKLVHGDKVKRNTVHKAIERATGKSVSAAAGRTA